MFIAPLPSISVHNLGHCDVCSTLRRRSSWFVSGYGLMSVRDLRDVFKCKMVGLGSSEPSSNSNLFGENAVNDALVSKDANSSVRKRQMLRVCRVCKCKFDVDENGPRSCRHHPQLFSGRLLRVTPTDTSDLTYFYDCCGATDSNAPGCTYSYHETYD